MRGVNKVIIVGRLGADPESRQFSNGGSVTNISVATSEQWTDKQTGQKREATEWHRVSLFNRLGEIAAQYLRKGSQVYIEGSLRTRKWQDQNGQDRYTTEVRADSLQMLGDPQHNNQNQNFNNNQPFNGQGQQPYNQQQPAGNQGYAQQQPQQPMNNQGYAQQQPQQPMNQGQPQPQQPANNQQPQGFNQQLSNPMGGIPAPGAPGGGGLDQDIPFAAVEVY